MYDNLAQQKSQLNLRIALWGPQSSGKTWFIHALPKIVEMCNKADPDFYYELSDSTTEKKNLPLSRTDFPAPTTKLTNYYYEFKRRAKQVTTSNVVSVHTHYLDIQDMSGHSSVIMNEQTKTIYRDAHMIILMLDPTLLSSFHAENTVQTSKNEPGDEDELDLSLLFDELERDHEAYPVATKISPREYAESVKKLFEFLSRQPEPHPLVAVCLSKSDLWKRNTTGNDLLLSTGFGLEMKSVLDRYKTYFSIHQFLISSMGYPAKGHKENYNWQTGTPQELQTWEPINVEKPLFWFLEKRELQKLSQGGGLIGMLFQDENVRKYKRYINLGKN